MDESIRRETGRQGRVGRGRHARRRPRHRRRARSGRGDRVCDGAVAALASDPEVRRWNGRSLSSGELAEVYGFTDIDGSRPNFMKYYREVIQPGKPADAERYR